VIANDQPGWQGSASPPVRLHVGQLCGHLPVIDADKLVMLGQRDEAYHGALAVPSIADRARLHPADQVHGRAGELAAVAAQRLARQTPVLAVKHVDLDVLDGAGCQNSSLGR
jgi:hypothetical protein